MHRLIGSSIYVAVDQAESIQRQPWPLLEGRWYWSDGLGIFFVVQCVWWGAILRTDMPIFSSNFPRSLETIGLKLPNEITVPVLWEHMGLPVLLEIADDADHPSAPV